MLGGRNSTAALRNVVITQLRLVWLQYDASSQLAMCRALYYRSFLASAATAAAVAAEEEDDNAAANEWLMCLLAGLQQKVITAGQSFELSSSPKIGSLFSHRRSGFLAIFSFSFISLTISLK